MSVDDWSSEEFDAIVDAIAGDDHPIQIARRFHKPVKEVAAFWHGVIGAWRHNEIELPPRVAEFDRRVRQAGVPVDGPVRPATAFGART